MKRILGLTAALLVAGLLMLGGCGGRGSSGGSGGPIGGGSGGTPQPLQMAISPVAGGHIFAKQVTTSQIFSFDLVTVAYAQTSSISLSQSWNGICNFAPAGQVDTIHGLLYGIGQMGQPNCTSSWYTGSDASGAAASGHGQLVIGNGTISNLVAWADEGSSMPTGIMLKLWVQRNGVAVDTGLSCVLQGVNFQKCSSTQLFQALDGDRVLATFTKPASDDFVGLNVLFTKE